jgi:DNA polymerase-1
MPRRDRPFMGVWAAPPRVACEAGTVLSTAPMPAALPPPGAPGVLYLVDLSGYVFRAYHAIAPLSSSKGEPTHAVLGTVNMLQKVVNERRPAMLAVAMDSRTRSFRKDLDDRYKANRPAPPPDLRQQMARVEEIVRAFNIPVFQKDGLEADDLIAAVVARAEKEGVRVVVVSADKDLMQIVHDDDDQIVLWDTMQNRVYGPEEVRAKLGVPPSQVRDYLALCGDTSDNVPGVPSVGPKTAAELLAQFGLLDGIYAGLAQVKRQRLRETLEKHVHDAYISRELVTLRADADVPWDAAHLAYGGADVGELRRLFVELEFGRLLDKLAAPEAGAAPVSGGGGRRSAEEPATAARVERRYELVRDGAGLEALARAAREGGRLALEVVGTGADPNRSAVLGVALSAEEGVGAYVPVGHRYLGAPAQVPWDAVKAALADVLADASVEKIGADLKTTEVLLARHGVALSEPTFDVRLAGYLLDPEAPGALEDLAQRELGVALAADKRASKPEALEALEVERAAALLGPRADAALCVARRLAPRLEDEGLAKLTAEVEAPLARVLAQMELCGVLVDTARLGEIGKNAEAELRELERRAHEAAGHEFSLRSRDQLEKILFDELRLPVLKRTPKGGRSTDADVLEELALEHPLPKIVLLHREIDKLKGTYLDALPRYVNPTTGRIHTRFMQTVAATGRLSSVDPNLQNIPVRTALGRAVRRAFVAPPGCSLVCADYSQIELRVLAHLSRDPVLLETYNKGEDVHARTASLVFDVPLGDVTADMRRKAKTINFGVIYGMGDAALARQLDIPRADAARFIEAYFRRYEGVARFMRDTVEAARRGEAVRTILGRRRFLPNLHSANRGLRMEAERIAKNTPIQGTAADILKVAMVRLGKEPVVPGARMVLTVHDELVFEVPDAGVEEAKARVRTAMEAAMTLDVPLVVDVGAGKSWADAK